MPNHKSRMMFQNPEIHFSFHILDLLSLQGRLVIIPFWSNRTLPAASIFQIFILGNLTLLLSSSRHSTELQHILILFNLCNQQVCTTLLVIYNLYTPYPNQEPLQGENTSLYIQHKIQSTKVNSASQYIMHSCPQYVFCSVYIRQIPPSEDITRNNKCLSTYSQFSHSLISIIFTIKLSTTECIKAKLP